MKRTYAAVAWPAGEAPDRVRRVTSLFTADGLQEILTTPGLVILARSPPYANPCAIVVGSLFRRPGCKGDNADYTDARTRAEWLVTRCFGSYVAFFNDQAGCHVLTDPSGAGRGYMASDRELTIVSDVITPDCMAAAGLAYRPRHETIAACIAHPPSIAAAVLLEGVTPMAPGVLYGLAHRAETTLWTPVRRSRIQAAPETLLRDAVDAAVVSCAGERPTVQLSGGLDSAIVATSLSASGRSFDAFTFRSGDGDVDELAYAEDVSRRCGALLHIETGLEPPDYGRLLAAPQHATPYVYGLDDVFEDALEKCAAGTRSQRILTGQGGDAVFFRTSSPWVTADRLRDVGPGSAFAQGLIQDALRSGRSIWHHLLPAAASFLRSPIVDRELLVPAVIHPERRSGLQVPLHPWIAAAAGLPPGRRLQIELIASCQLFHSHRPFGTTQLANPLLAQPVLEAVLTMPSWQIADGPLDRGLARSAFGSRLPASVAGRVSKGEASARFGRAAVANLGTLRHHLLGGALAEAGIVDEAYLARMLDPTRMFYSLDYRAIAVLVSCEAWLRAWR